MIYWIQEELVERKKERKIEVNNCYVINFPYESNPAFSLVFIWKKEESEKRKLNR
jgi:hypothetical protein